MAFKIIWSDFAESQLDQIYEYYEKRASAKIAKSLVRGIISAPDSLIEAAYIGQEEESLIHRKIKYRYIVFKNYKLIYSVDNENGFIKIADVFDTRQNPIKIDRAK